MGRVNSEAAALLVAGICRGKFWASPEETERWLKTETGQRLQPLSRRNGGSSKMTGREFNEGLQRHLMRCELQYRARERTERQ